MLGCENFLFNFRSSSLRIVIAPLISPGSKKPCHFEHLAVHLSDDVDRVYDIGVWFCSSHLLELRSRRSWIDSVDTKFVGWLQENMVWTQILFLLAMSRTFLLLTLYESTWFPNATLKVVLLSLSWILVHPYQNVC